MKINYKTIIKVVIGIILLAVALNKIDSDKIAHHFQQCDHRLLLLTALISFASTFWILWVRNQLLNLLEKTSFGVMLKTFFATNYIRNFIPASLGGFLAQPWGLYSFSKGSITLEKGLAFVILTVITQNIRRIILTILGLLCFFTYLPTGYTAVIVLSVAAYIAYSSFMLLIIFPAQSSPFVLKPILTACNRFASKLLSKIKSFDRIGHNFRLMLSDKKSYLILAVLVISNVALESLRLWLLLLSFGVSFNFFMLLLIPSMAYSVTVLPISIGGLGVAELSGVIIFESFGIDPEIALAVIFLDRFLFSYWGFVLGGLFVPFMTAPERLKHDKDHF